MPLAKPSWSPKTNLPELGFLLEAAERFAQILFLQDGSKSLAKTENKSFTVFRII